METKITDFFKFCFTKQLRYATYDLETCYSNLGSIKHTYTWLSYFHISVSAFFFLFSFCIVGHNNNNNNNNNNNSNNYNNNK